MLLENNTITIAKSAVKHYGGLGAIILQELYSEYGGQIKIDVEEWRETCLDYIPQATIKRVLTELRNSGKIEMDESYIYLREPEKKPQTIFDAGVKKPEKEKKENPTWEMALELCRIVGQQENFLTPKRYLRFAKELIEDGRTIEFMKKRYGKGGEWYTHEYLGQQGKPPSVQDIRITINNEYGTKKKDGVKTLWSN